MSGINLVDTQSFTFQNFQQKVGAERKCLKGETDVAFQRLHTDKDWHSDQNGGC